MLKTLQNHPRGLYILFATEMWERFNYYGMRALLVLYLTAQLLQGGLGYSRTEALAIYATFTALVYLTPILGGFIADKYIGQRKSILIGGLLMALAQFVIAKSSYGDISQRNGLFTLGLGICIIGNGFFKPNISTLVSHLYHHHDTKKDAAFTIFYMGINLGAFLAPFVCGTIAVAYGWAYGFVSAGLGMCLGLIWFLSQQKDIILLEPRMAEKNPNLQTKDIFSVLSFVVCSVLLVVIVLFAKNTLSVTLQEISLRLIELLAILFLVGIIVRNTQTTQEWQRVGIIVVLCFFNMLFWAGFEQAGGTLNLFAEQNTNRYVGSFQIPTSWFQSINSVFIIALAPLFSMLWYWLSSRNRNPNIPLKFALGLFLLGLGFVLMSVANKTFLSSQVAVSPLWLIGVYAIHTIAELCLSPIGLSMVTQLAPQKIVSVMMGLWFGATAFGNYLAGTMEGLLLNYFPNIPLFDFLSLTSILGALVLLALSPLLKHWL